MVSYRGPHDHVQWHQNLQSKQNGDGATADIPIVLSSTRQDLPINMQQCYEDAMIILKKYGKSDYFITMTCNPQKPQIACKLRTCQTSLNMSHLVSCVLQQYLNAFISDLWENGILGRSIARIHVIEFQKQGYPQTHILLTVPQVVKSMMSGTMTLQSLLKFQICNLC